jgi:Na+/melibiose symporter-like transporter
MIGLMKISEWGIWQASDAATSIMGISPSPFLVLAGLVVFYFFLQWEKRRDANGSDCLLPMEFVKSAQVRAGLGITAFAFMAFVTITFVVVSYIQLVGEFSAMKTAGILLFFSAGMIAGSLGAPALLAKWSASAVNSLGFAAIIIGMVSMYFGLEVTGINFLMTLGMVLFGIGLGVVSAQMSLIVTEAISHQGAMQSGGVQATFRGIGEALGIAVLGTVLMLSTTSSIKKMGLSHQEISRETADLIIDINTIPFSTNESFKRILDDYVNNEKDKEVLMTIKADARKKAAGHSLFAMMSLVAVFYLLFQKAVPKRSLMDN